LIRRFEIWSRRTGVLRKTADLLEAASSA